MTRSCTKACMNGNPYRGYVCRCAACEGKAHGAMRIDLKMLEEIVDRKLLDPTLGKADARRWMAVMRALLAHDPSTARRATKRAA